MHFSSPWMLNSYLVKGERLSLSLHLFYESWSRYIANQSGSAKETVTPKISKNIEMLVCFTNVLPKCLHQQKLPYLPHSTSWQEQYQCKSKPPKWNKQFCKTDKLDFINKSDITDQKLYGEKKLHINDTGKSLLANIFIKYSINMWIMSCSYSDMSLRYQGNDSCSYSDMSLRYQGNDKNQKKYLLLQILAKILILI